MLTSQTLYPKESPLRDIITNAYRMDETACLNELLPQAAFSAAASVEIAELATQLVIATRAYKKKQNKLDTLLHQYDLSTDEGIALMCLAEALLRIPDKATVDIFISDKLSTADWQEHLDRDQPLFINAATWSLLMTGKIYAPALDQEKNLWSSLKRVSSRLGACVLRPIIMQMMKAIGKQFVLGETIQSALEKATELQQQGYRFSFDMLGEAARTQEDADYYFASYQNAIHAIGQSITSQAPAENHGISIKLSALYPRYEFAQYQDVMTVLTPRLLTLCQLAKKYCMGLTVDAEEADRLDLSLDLIEKIFTDASLAGWEGFGLALQAYQKRASKVIDWLADLAQKQQKKWMLRLIKGAYWDAEIKQSQVMGLNYPVFTRKFATDVSYLACAKKILNLPTCFYPQFGTHNAYSVAALLTMTKHTPAFEFQCLHGMGRALYDQVVAKDGFNKPCRIYAPVGTHRDLLGYLVRRLLENGANTSFINKLADDKTPIEKIVVDPVAYINQLISKPHPKIPNYQHIYGAWSNSTGIDLSNRKVFAQLKNQLDHSAEMDQAASLVGGKIWFDEAQAYRVSSPQDNQSIIGKVCDGDEQIVAQALTIAEGAKASWGARAVEERAAILERAAGLLQENMAAFIAILVKEGGKCVPDCISEIREAIDFCHYYAHRARLDLTPKTLPSPTGETDLFSLHPRGIIACISPWNFPLAIFTGQIVAALVTGNTVIAKPAEQTPIVAFKMVQLLHQAGVPTDALQLVIGKGEVVGAKIVSSEKIAGVMFTGSTATAKAIERALANREGPIGFLIAETGGQNAMIVDSSALPEQAVQDIVQSAFNSAGQRCSALRVLFVQEELAPRLISLLQGVMADLKVGDPSQLSTDIGPVIDLDAQQMLMRHFAKMNQLAHLIAQTPMALDRPGTFFAPCAFELSDLSSLTEEVFGPILHVIRYKAGTLNQVIDAVIKTGYGLTLGIESRIDATIDYIISRMPVGNVYVNRNIVGAVVGVQPFGGEGLSGTGPKAGGPHYLPRLCVERTLSVNTTAVGGNARLVSLLEEDE